MTFGVRNFDENTEAIHAAAVAYSVTSSQNSLTQEKSLHAATTFTIAAPDHHGTTAIPIDPGVTDEIDW